MSDTDTQMLEFIEQAKKFFFIEEHSYDRGNPLLLNIMTALEDYRLYFTDRISTPDVDPEYYVTLGRIREIRERDLDAERNKKVEEFNNRHSQASEIQEKPLEYATHERKLLKQGLTKYFLSIPIEQAIVDLGSLGATHSLIACLNKVSLWRFLERFSIDTLRQMHKDFVENDKQHSTIDRIVPLFMALSKSKRNSLCLMLRVPSKSRVAFDENVLREFLHTQPVHMHGIILKYLENIHEN